MYDPELSNERRAALDEMTPLAAAPLIVPIGQTQPKERVYWRRRYGMRSGRTVLIVDEPYVNKATKIVRDELLTEELYGDVMASPEDALIAMIDGDGECEEDMDLPMDSNPYHTFNPVHHVEEMEPLHTLRPKAIRYTALDPLRAHQRVVIREEKVFVPRRPPQKPADPNEKSEASRLSRTFKQEHLAARRRRFRQYVNAGIRFRKDGRFCGGRNYGQKHPRYNIDRTTVRTLTI